MSSLHRSIQKEIRVETETHHIFARHVMIGDLVITQGGPGRMIFITQDVVGAEFVHVDGQKRRVRVDFSDGKVGYFVHDETITVVRIHVRLG